MNLREALSYERFSRSPRVLVFGAHYLVVGDLVSGMRGLGWEVGVVELFRAGTDEFVQEVLKRLILSRPDFILAVNHLGFDVRGLLSGLFEEYGIVHAVWYVDHPMPILEDTQGVAVGHCQVFSIERSTLGWLERKGFEDPRYLPLGASSLFHSRSSDLGCELGFVGHSWYEKVLTGDRFAQQSMMLRKGLVEALLPLGLRVHGDPYWAELIPGLEVGAELDPILELPGFFASTEVNVNITAAQLSTAVNQRVWNVPAVGSFLLTDAQEDALEFFQDEIDICLYRDFEEAKDKVRYYLKKPLERLKIAERGYELVSTKHRMEHRLVELYSVMKKRFKD